MNDLSAGGVSRRRFLGTVAAAGAASIGATVGEVAHAAGSLDRSGTKATPASSDPPPGAIWTLDPSKSDEFSGPAVDASKWFQTHWNPASNNVGFNPANSTVSGGNLHLAITKVPFNGADYSGGVVRSRFTIGGNSYTEVRARMVSRRANVLSAIWLHEEATNVEIDMQEYQFPLDLPQQIHSAIHLWIPPSSNTVLNVNHASGVDLDADFHLYGLERRDGVVSFYFDDEMYASYPAAADSHPEAASEQQPIICYIRGLSGGRDPIDAGIPSEMLVDYVRVYTVG